MLPSDRQRRSDANSMMDGLMRAGMNRREFIKRSALLGLGASAAGPLLAACGTTQGANKTSTVKSNTVDLLNVWSGEEQASFKAAIAPFVQKTGITVNVESTRDLTATLTTRIQGNNPPDMAVLPNPAEMQLLASQGHLVPLNALMDIGTIQNDYSKAWLDLGSYNSNIYALFYKAANKATVWYSPDQFTANNYSTPQTWNDLLTLSQTIASSGKYPWSMGVSSGSASGWPAADWIDQIYLLQNGPDKYDQWYNHKIPWTDSSVQNAFQAFGQIAHGNHFVNGGAQAILATGFQEASYDPFTSPPTSYMYYLGDFTQGFITTQFPNAKAGTNYDFFAFPGFGTNYDGAVTGGADVVVALKNTTAVQQLMAYLETAQAQEIWVQRGGFTAVNKNVPLSAYPNPIAQKSAQQLVNAPVFRFGADDLMPPQVENAFWAGTLTYIQHADQLNTILSTIESTASQAYSS